MSTGSMPDRTPSEARAWPKHLKCAFCDWTGPTFTRLKNGRRRNGYELLRSHVMDEHEGEWDRIQEAIGPEYEDEL